MTSSICPVCQYPIAIVNDAPNSVDALDIDCQFCGKFRISRTAQKSLPTYLSTYEDTSFRISHAIRKIGQQNNFAELNTTSIESIIKHPLPRPREQADLLIRWIAENCLGPGGSVKLKFLQQGAYIGSKTLGGFLLIVDYLLESKLIKQSLDDGGNSISDNMFVTLTFLGWDRYEELRLGRTFYNRAFMAMKYHDNELDNIFINVFKLSAGQAGFELLKLDENPKAGLIDNHMRVEIQSSAFLIADLTHENAGAYWEAGYAEGLGKPVIYTCKKDKFLDLKTHFDTNHHTTILWDINNCSKTQEELKATIRNTLPHLSILQDRPENNN